MGIFAQNIIRIELSWLVRGENDHYIDQSKDILKSTLFNGGVSTNSDGEVDDK